MRANLVASEKWGLDKVSNSSLHLAPMVGITHFVVRKAISEYLPAGFKVLWPTEMLSARRLPHQKVNQTPEIMFWDVEAGLGPQLLGNEEKEIQDAVKRLEDWGAVSIDINMGCPVNKALKHNYGVALMGDPDYAAKVTEMAVKSTSLPVSVKLRAGLQKDENFLVKFTRGIESAGAAWITLHPRTAAEKRRGFADWSQISLVKKSLSIPVIGNGDIQSASDVVRMLEQTGCDRVMAGRILTAKPWILGELISNSKKSSEEEAAEYGKFLLRILDLSEEYYEEAAGIKRFQFLLYHGHVWLEFGHFLWSSCRKPQNYRGIREAIIRFFSEPRRMFERTELRQ